MVKAPDGSELQIVWRLRDQQSLERELERIYGDAAGREAWLQSVVETFYWRLQSHPREWPTASAPPSDHSFRFYGVEIRYRVYPADETVEVLSVASLRPQKVSLMPRQPSNQSVELTATRYTLRISYD